MARDYEPFAHEAHTTEGRVASPRRRRLLGQIAGLAGVLAALALPASGRAEEEINPAAGPATAPAEMPGVRASALAAPAVSPRAAPEFGPHLRSPEDIKDEIMSPEELELKYRMKILDLSNQEDFVKLGFRKSGPLFDPLFEDQAGKPYILHWVLVDGPNVNPAYLNEDSRKALPPEAIYQLEMSAERFLSITRSELGRNQKRKLRIYNETKRSLEISLQNGQMSQDAFNVESQALDFEYRDYQEGVSDETLMERWRGVTISPEFDGTEHAYIFLPARDLPDPVFESGKERIVIRLPSDLKGEPKPFQSYVDPDSRFTVNEADRSYPIQNGNTPASSAKHEGEHARGIEHPYTDFNIIDYYRRARQAYLNGDDRMYWMTWETPRGLTVSQIAPPVAA